MPTPMRPMDSPESPAGAGDGHTSSMRSTNRHAANCRNALRSTGPRTAAGKSRVRWNALRHGVLARDLLLPGEDPAALEALAKEMRAAWQPVGAEEEALVEHMIACRWRLRRLTRVETGILSSEYFGILVERAHREARTHVRTNADVLEQTLDRPTITDAVMHQHAVAKADEAARLGEADTPTLGHAFVRGVRGADPLSKLSRYEAGIERSYYRALHELQRRQVARLGGQVPPPLALDVTVTREGDSC